MPQRNTKQSTTEQQSQPFYQRDFTLLSTGVTLIGFRPLTPDPQQWDADGNY